MPNARLDEITAGADEMLTLYGLARALPGLGNITDTGDVIARHLRRLIPFSESILFLVDGESTELVARHLPQYPFDETFLKTLPEELLQVFQQYFLPVMAALKPQGNDLHM